jgi:hypothetical protein
VKLMANAEAEKITKTGQAEAEKILAIGKSNAEAYKLSVEAMGGNNFTQLKVTEAIGLNKIKVIPDVLITGSGDSANSSISGLLGIELMKQISEKAKNADKKEE